MLWLGTGDGYIYIFNILVKARTDINTKNNITNNQANKIISERPKAKVSKTKSICLHDVKILNKKHITFANKQKEYQDVFVENIDFKKSFRKWNSEYLNKKIDDESSEDQNQLLTQILNLSYSNLNETSYNDDLITKYLMESEKINDNNSVFSDNHTRPINDFEEINNNYISDDLWSGSSRKSWIWDNENESVLSQSNNIKQSRARSTNSFSCNESLIFPKFEMSPSKTPNLSDNETETTNFYNDEDDETFFSNKKISPKRKSQNQISRIDKNDKSIFLLNNIHQKNKLKYNFFSSGKYL